MFLALNILLVAGLLLAVYFDASTRTFPNALCLFLLVVAGLVTFFGPGVALLLRNSAFAVATVAVLYLFELLWRNVRHAAGLGMGDVKALAVLMLVSPFVALAAFIAGLLLLALACLLARKPSLPLLPFVIPVLLLLEYLVPLLG